MQAAEQAHQDRTATAIVVERDLTIAGIAALREAYAWVPTARAGAG